MTSTLGGYKLSSACCAAASVSADAPADSWMLWHAYPASLPVGVLWPQNTEALQGTMVNEALACICRQVGCTAVGVPVRKATGPRARPVAPLLHPTFRWMQAPILTHLQAGGGVVSLERGKHVAGHHQHAFSTRICQASSSQDAGAVEYAFERRGQASGSRQERKSCGTCLGQLLRTLCYAVLQGGVHTGCNATHPCLLRLTPQHGDSAIGTTAVVGTPRRAAAKHRHTGTLHSGAELVCACCA